MFYVSSPAKPEKVVCKNLPKFINLLVLAVTKKNYCMDVKMLIQGI